MRHVFKSRRSRTKALMEDFEEHDKAEVEADEKASASIEECLFNNKPIPESEWHRYQFNRDKANRQANKQRQAENKRSRELLIDHIISCDIKHLAEVLIMLFVAAIVAANMGTAAWNNFVGFVKWLF